MPPPDSWAGVQPRPYDKMGCRLEAGDRRYGTPPKAGDCSRRLEVHFCYQPQELSLRATPQAWRGNLNGGLWSFDFSL